MLREVTTKPTIGIFEAAITQALLVGKRFGVVTTGTGYKFNLYNGVRAFMGASSERFAGLVTTGLGVVELREGDREKIEKNVKEASGEMASQGADVILLGCAGESDWWVLLPEDNSYCLSCRNGRDGITGRTGSSRGKSRTAACPSARRRKSRCRNAFRLDQVIRVTILIM